MAITHFDVALSFYVTCTVRPEACIKLFKEMHRVLVPGGKTVVNCISKPAFEKLTVRSGTDPVLVEKEITKNLIDLMSYPTQDQINKIFMMHYMSFSLLMIMVMCKGLLMLIN